MGTARGPAVDPGSGRETGAAGCAGRCASFDGPPLGPPGLRSFPDVIGLPGIRLPFGVGLETELGFSPGPVRISPLL